MPIYPKGYQMPKDDTSKLKRLGEGKTCYVYDSPSASMLETFPNQYPKNTYVVNLNCKEFTSLCPKTGQPDFAEIKIKYNPNEVCVETKSLKLYLFAFRNCGTFMETIVNWILNDLVKVLQPHYIEVEGIFKVRGGIKLVVEATYHAKI